MMTMKDIVATIRELAMSQGSYGRMYEDLKDLQASNPAAYAKLAKGWEAEGFETTLDLVLYLEEGKHCKRKFWNIPVRWVCEGVIEVEGATMEEALENFKKDADMYGTQYALPEGEYVDDSFGLAEIDKRKLKSRIKKLNKNN